MKTMHDARPAKGKFPYAGHRTCAEWSPTECTVCGWDRRTACAFERCPKRAAA